MSGTVYLCGHTGSQNRGSEAIIRCTAKWARQEWPEKKVVLMTFDAASDAANGATAAFDEVVTYSGQTNWMHKLWSAFCKRVLRREGAAFRWRQRNLLNRLTTDDVVLNVGGDIYCYPKAARLSYALIDFTYQRGITSIFWGCSLEEKLLDAQMVENLKRYTLIYPRERITKELLLRVGVDKEKIIQRMDPAFWLEQEQVTLPFSPGAIAINLSPIAQRSEQRKGIIKEAFMALITQLLTTTNKEVVLVPHVYWNANSEDTRVLSELKQAFPSPRVVLLTGDYNCCQLKYILANCELLVCSRTHASIAAYSAGVPALVVGYSTKAKGIALELFGTTKGYVIEAEQVTTARLLHDYKALYAQRTAIHQLLQNKRRDYL